MPITRTWNLGSEEDVFIEMGSQEDGASVRKEERYRSLETLLSEIQVSSARVSAFVFHIFGCCSGCLEQCFALLVPWVFVAMRLFAIAAETTPTVIIIGEGMSGISVAKMLSDASIKDILILESTYLIGGRMHKTDFAGLSVEMGANWVEAAETTPTVIIIGAGMSGISATKTLSDVVIKDILILESTDRIGGRMHKTDFAGLSIEVGANWVEGVNGKEVNPIWSMVNKIHLKTFYSDYDRFGC